MLGKCQFVKSTMVKKSVVGIVSNILFSKKAKFIPGSTRIFQLNTLILQSIDSRCLKTLTSYLKLMVAPVSPTYGYNFRNILECILRNLLQTSKNINQ